MTTKACIRSRMRKMKYLIINCGGVRVRQRWASEFGISRLSNFASGKRSQYLYLMYVEIVQKSTASKLEVMLRSTLSTSNLPCAAWLQQLCTNSLCQSKLHTGVRLILPHYRNYSIWRCGSCPDMSADELGYVLAVLVMWSSYVERWKWQKYNSVCRYLLVPRDPPYVASPVIGGLYCSSVASAMSPWRAVNLN